MSDASTPEGNASDDQESPDSVPSHADSKIQNLVNIRTRLSTGRHTPGLTNNQRSTVNKQLPLYKLDDQGRLCHVKDGISREVVFDIQRKHQIFNEAHIGHPGRNITVSNITRAYVWRNVKEEVSQLINFCPECQKTQKMKTMAPVLQSIHTSRPWEKVGIDCVGKLTVTSEGHCYIMSVTDLFSKWVELYPLYDKSAPEIAQNLHRFIMRHGAPEAFISDQGIYTACRYNILYFM